MIETISQAAAVASLPGAVELAALSAAALLPQRRRVSWHGRTPRIAVVVPAHNEEAGIAACIASLKQSPGADIVVVADNCSDATADAARAQGVRVLERCSKLRGKGHALQFAFQRLAAEGYEAFIVVDADSRVPVNFVAAFASAFAGGADAAQARYLVANPGEGPRTRLMDVALRGFNAIRPAGRARLGLSAGISGNGFGLTAALLAEIPYTAHSIVEDLEYHLMLVRNGRRVAYLPETAVYGAMPAGGPGVATQRARWEGGRFRLIAAFAPGLARDILRGQFRLLEPLGDLLLLPLAFQSALFALALLGSGWSRAAGVAGFAVIALHLAAILRAGRSPLADLRALALAPLYILWKLALLPRILASAPAGTGWVRTPRAGESA